MLRQLPSSPWIVWLALVDLDNQMTRAEEKGPSLPRISHRRPFRKFPWGD